MDRYHFDAITTDQDLADTYLPAFEACVVQGHGENTYNHYYIIPSFEACILQGHGGKTCYCFVSFAFCYATNSNTYDLVMSQTGATN